MAASTIGAAASEGDGGEEESKPPAKKSGVGAGEGKPTEQNGDAGEEKCTPSEKKTDVGLEESRPSEKRSDVGEDECKTSAKKSDCGEDDSDVEDFDYEGFCQDGSKELDPAGDEGKPRGKKRRGGAGGDKAAKRRKKAEKLKRNVEALQAAGAALPESAKKVMKREVADYSDAMPAQSSGEMASSSSSTGRLFDRVDKDCKRIADKRDKDQARTVFVTNLPFRVSTTQQVNELMGQSGKVVGTHLATDKHTHKPCGYGFVRFETPSEAVKAVEELDKKELNDPKLNRVVRVAPCASGTKFKFELPEELQEQLLKIMREGGVDGQGYEGKNISAVRQAWQKTCGKGQQLNVSKWGFDKFNTAMASIPGIALEPNPLQPLTIHGFIKDSEKHKRAKELAVQIAKEKELEKAKKAEEAKEAELKKAKEEDRPKEETGEAKEAELEKAKEDRPKEETEEAKEAELGKAKKEDGPNDRGTEDVKEKEAFGAKGSKEGVIEEGQLEDQGSQRAADERAVGNAAAEPPSS